MTSNESYKLLRMTDNAIFHSFVSIYIYVVFCPTLVSLSDFRTNTVYKIERIFGTGYYALQLWITTDCL